MASEGHVDETGNASVVSCGLYMRRMEIGEAKLVFGSCSVAPGTWKSVWSNQRTGLSCDSVIESKHIGHLAHLHDAVER